MNKLNEISILRVFAVLLVVLGHSTIIYSGTWFKTAIVDSIFFLYIYKIIYSFHIPLFVFISGYLYYYCNIENNCKYSNIQFFIKKFKRLIVPYLFIAIFWMIPIRLYIGFYNEISIYNILFKGIILSNNTGSLWFLLMLFNILIFFYILDKKFTNKNINLFLIIFTFIHLISIEIPYTNKTIPNIFQIRQSMNFVIFFYLGFIYRMNIEYIKIFIIKKFKFYNIAISFIFYVILFIFNDYYKVDFLNIYITYSNEIIKITVSLLMIHALYSLLITLNKVTLKINNNEMFIFLNKHNFSIFLFHAPIIYIITFKLYNNFIRPEYMVSICFVSSIFISILISALIDKSKILRPLIGL